MFLAGCSGIKLISKEDVSDLYSSKFLTEVEEIKTLYKSGESDKALQVLLKMEESKLVPVEKAMRRNLIGVIYFGKENFEQAIFNFNQGLTTSSEDQSLTAQLQLNLGGSYYRLDMIEKAYEVIADAPFKALSTDDIIKFHRLRYNLADELGKDDIAIRSLIWTMADKQTVSELRIDVNYEQLTSRFNKLERNQKFKILEEYEEEAPFIVGYLSYLEAEKTYYSGKKDDAKYLIKWVGDNFGKYPEIETLLNNFTFKLENYAKLKPYNIGVILPLTGARKSYGKRALLGIDSALRDYKKNNPEAPPFNLIVKDDKGTGVVGSNAVKELVERDFVSVIIGGLSPAVATKEFEVAKKRGVFFVSLSPIYLDKEDKDHLLLEVPGSIESQINQVFSEENLTQFGKRGAIIYPKTKLGNANVNEFWRKANIANLDVSGVYSFEESASDFRETIKNLLGLKYPRERQEEYELLEEIHQLENNRSTRRIQTLKPQLDFDWVFVPAFPLQAVQIIPSFNYYDAFNVPVIGGPSWRSRSLSKESYKFKGVFFVGDDVAQTSEELSKSFFQRYGKKLGLVELRSYDSMNIALNLLGKNTFASRDELDMTIRGLQTISGETGKWNLLDGIWLKELATLHMRRGKISRVDVAQNEPNGQKNEASEDTKPVENVEQ